MLVGNEADKIISICLVISSGKFQASRVTLHVFTNATPHHLFLTGGAYAVFLHRHPSMVKYFDF